MRTDKSRRWRSMKRTGTHEDAGADTQAAFFAAWSVAPASQIEASIYVFLARAEKN